jgi:hypothetical protein
LRLDLDTEALDAVAVTSTHGATGMCRMGEEIFVVPQMPDGHVAVFDLQTLEQTHSAPLEGARDVHSIVPGAGGIAVASTGTDEVLWYWYDDGVFIGRTVLWAAGDERRDVHHVNGLTVWGDRLLCCGFGERRSPDDLWSASRGGFVRDVTSGDVLATSLLHPHSPALWNGRLILCESSVQTVRTTDAAIVRLPGYTRGFAALDADTALVGTSVGRTASRSMGRLLSPSDAGSDAGICALHVIDASGGVLRTIELTRFGREVYDVLSVDDGS